MNIYLAGNLGHSTQLQWQEQLTGWKVAHQPSAGGWPITQDAVLGKHGYTGPYFSKQSAAERVENMVHAIAASDLLFAWFPEPYLKSGGIEIGLACGLAVPVVIAAPRGTESLLSFLKPFSKKAVQADNGATAKEALEFTLSDLDFVASVEKRHLERNGQPLDLNASFIRDTLRKTLADVQSEPGTAIDKAQAIARLCASALLLNRSVK